MFEIFNKDFAVRFQSYQRQKSRRQLKYDINSIKTLIGAWLLFNSQTKPSQGWTIRESKEEE